MGLDMSLMKRKRGENEGNWVEIAYWRKANQIRNWIITHTKSSPEANCEYIILSKELIEELINDCIDVENDHSLAQKLIPTQSGFFFGSTDYDENYFQVVLDTVILLENVLDDVDWDTEEVAYYDWW